MRSRPTAAVRMPVMIQIKELTLEKHLKQTQYNRLCWIVFYAIWRCMSLVNIMLAYYEVGEMSFKCKTLYKMFVIMYNWKIILIQSETVKQNICHLIGQIFTKQMINLRFSLNFTSKNWNYILKQSKISYPSAICEIRQMRLMLYIFESCCKSR